MSASGASGPTIREFVAWYCSEPRLAFNRTVVLRYWIHLEQRGYAPATIDLRLAAVRRMAYEAADARLLSPELAAGIRRVKGGRRLLEWATPSTAPEVVGKGQAHVHRSHSTWVKSTVDAWTAAAAITHGPVFRAINKAGRVWGDGMSPNVLCRPRRGSSRRDSSQGP